MLQVYKASAGSGKTFTLAKKYISLLFDSKREKVFRHILAVTFTNKATEEMKTRIVEELHKLAIGAESKYSEDLMIDYHLTSEQLQRKAGTILKDLLFDYSSFSVSTIDRFFQQVIRSFAREIGVNGSYQLEVDSMQVLDQAVDNLFIELNNSENKQLLQWLIQYADEQIQDGKSWNTRQNIFSIGIEIFKESYQHKAEATREKLHDKTFLDAYKHDLKQIKDDFTSKALSLGKKGLAILETYGLTPEDSIRKVLSYFHKIQRSLDPPTASFLKTADDVANCYTQKASADLKNKFELAYNNGLQKVILDLIALFEKDIIQYNTAKLILSKLHSLGILTDLAVELKKLTVDENTMLIADSNLLLHKIIDNSDAPFVYEKTGLKIDNFMIDEFQDTSGLQWQNFLPLIQNSMSNNNENLVVGDIKQSIYRWRNSEWRLLKEKIYNDFRKDQIMDFPLLENWRSDLRIVEFNNLFFRESSAILQSKLNEQLMESGAPEELNHLHTIINDAYSDVGQTPAKKESNGYVRFEFIETENSAEEEKDGETFIWQDLSMQRMVEDIEDLQRRNFKAGQICILVRDKKEEKLVVEFLLKHKNSSKADKNLKYDIVSQEGLLVRVGSTVRFLLALLHLIQHPENKIQSTILQLESAKLNVKKEAIQAKIESTIALGQVSLFELTEHLIREFNLGQIAEEVLFLQSFQDIVFRFSNKKSSDLNSFLQWWEKNELKQFIPVPESNEAIRIMTIHKSKGLDFDAVIIPFFHWKLNGDQRSLIWCPIKEEPYNKLPLIPVSYSSNLAKSHFANYYFNELMQFYVDNLNLAYVAFTRSKHELIVYAPLPKKLKNTEEISIHTVGSLAYKTFESLGTTEFERGEKLILKQSQFKEHTIFSNTYPSIATGDRLRLKHNLMLSSAESDWNNPIGHGTMMHELLQRIQKPLDAENALTTMLREGKIDDKELISMRAELTEFWGIEGVKEWFDEKYQVLNERSILTPTGKFYRPDRIILCEQNAIVIDYKFGENELNSHRKQIANYQQLLTEMGYETKAFLCYVGLKKVVSLQSQ